MKKFVVLMSVVAMVAVTSWGCQQADQSAAPAGSTPAGVAAGDHDGHDHPHVDLTLCGSCGDIKGSAACCEENAEKCASCTLVKGSPGCCKIEAGTDVALCAHCGSIPGTDECCKEGAEKCEKCKMAKGSPGCCKVPSKSAG